MYVSPRAALTHAAKKEVAEENKIADEKNKSRRWKEKSRMKKEVADEKKKSRMKRKVGDEKKNSRMKKKESRMKKSQCPFQATVHYFRQALFRLVICSA